jgi:zinc transport system ATP-binding protein
MHTAVTFEDVFFSYQDALVIENATFSIAPGEFVGIIGPNGGGKTTLLRLAMGFLTPNSGTITIYGATTSHAQRHLGYVPQSVRFDKQFPISVLDLVLQGRLSKLPWYGQFSRYDVEKAQHALEIVGLEDFQDRAFGTLSGGQAQRALMARALAGDPELLLLDEPTANVDSKVEAGIYEILKNLQSKITIVMVTHNLHAAIDLVDRVLCVQRTVTALKPEQVCLHYTQGLYHTPMTSFNAGGSR